METAVVMKRTLFNCEISQNSKTEYFSATDLLKAGNKWRAENGLSILNIEDWKKNKQSQDFMRELESSEGKLIYLPGRGRGVHTWVHPFIFIDIALWINPKLKIEVYKWLYDSLIKYRNQSGDSYKKMCGALYLTSSNKSYYQNEIQDIALKIKQACVVSDWQQATEHQLKLRDKIHDYIALFSDIIHTRDALVSVAIQKARESLA